jgi:hypothetical protein
MERTGGVDDQFSSTVEAVKVMKDSFRRRQARTAKLSDANRELVWSEIEQRLSQFEEPNGFNAPGEWLIGVGTK